MVSKTRDRLIEVARQLFARKGIENTTMNDIAGAADKGRRTIYTYFKSKRDIYNAVIERESEQLVSRLRRVAMMDVPPRDKLARYLAERFDELTDVAPKHEGLLSFFGRDIRRVDRIRKQVLAKELELFRGIIAEGVASGDFDGSQGQRLPALEAMVFQGADYSHLHDNFDETGMSADEIRDNIIAFIIDAVTCRGARASGCSIALN